VLAVVDATKPKPPKTNGGSAQAAVNCYRQGQEELKRMHQERWREPSDDDEHSLYAVALRAAVIFAAIDSPIALPFISR
jgi:hypothetical protein